MADLQRATSHTCSARCRGDLDRQGSDPHHGEASGNAAGLLQVQAAEHQAPRRRCSPLLVSFRELVKNCKIVFVLFCIIP